MNGDFSRSTFDAKKHYLQVLMQQGRVQLDADWNEQAAIVARRDRTTSRDLIGCCGGPADNAAFEALTRTPEGLDAPQSGDFYLSTGRYYVDGIQCEIEAPVLFSRQPDRPTVSTQPQDDRKATGTSYVLGLAGNGPYLLYLDVWQRHITSLEDGAIRESALGGPDTATRVKTVWQVRAIPFRLSAPPNPFAECGQKWADRLEPPNAHLTAGTSQTAASDSPCDVPEGAGYRGLENQLYRVEIHDSGAAVDFADPSAMKLTLGRSSNQINVPATSEAPSLWHEGRPVEILSGKSGTDPVDSQLAWIAKVENKGRNVLITLNTGIANLTQADDPRLRPVLATWKWSRENGSVASPIVSIKDQDITVPNLDLGEPRSFHAGDWVEILDDAYELEGTPGQLARIKSVGDKPCVITLWAPVTRLVPADGDFTTEDRNNGVVSLRHPKLRRWEGVAAVRCSATPPGAMRLPLEDGVHVRFDVQDGYRTGQYWQIPARAATATHPRGDIEWPQQNGEPESRAPRGILHHYCRLGIVELSGSRVTRFTDWRCLWPALAGPRLEYIGGTGQEVVAEPGASASLPLPCPIAVYVDNLQSCGNYRLLRFRVTPAQDQLEVKVSAGVMVSDASGVLIVPGADGVILCEWRLNPQALPANGRRRLDVDLLDENRNPVLQPPPLFFTATVITAAHHAKHCCPTVGPGGDYATVDEAIRKLLAAAVASKAKVREICLCLMPGEHTPPRFTLVNNGKGDLHLRISGCGRGTRLRLKDSAKFVGLTSFTLRDLEIAFEGNLKDQTAAIDLDSCGDVTVTGCSITGITDTGALLSIQNARRVRLQNNCLEAGLQSSLDTTTLTAVLGSSNAAQLAANMEWSSFQVSGMDLANQLFADLAAPAAKMPTGAPTPIPIPTPTPIPIPIPTPTRAVMVQTLTGLLDKKTGGARFSDAEWSSYEKLNETLKLGSNTDANAYFDAMFRIRAAALKARPGVAIAIGGQRSAAGVDTPPSCGDDDSFLVLENNEITGVVCMMGWPEAIDVPKSEVILKLIAGWTRAMPRLSGSVQMRGNRLTRIGVGALWMKQFADGKTPSLFGQCTLTDNAVEGLGSLVIACQVSLVSNQFPLTSSPPTPAGSVAPAIAGTSVSDSAVFVGNQSQSQSKTPPQWQCITSSNQKAAVANLRLTIT